MVKPGSLKQFVGEKSELAVNVLLLLAVLVFIGGASARLSQKKPAASTADGSDTTNLQERQQAIEEAKKNGQKDYSYTSGFNPGLGGGP